MGSAAVLRLCTEQCTSQQAGTEHGCTQPGVASQPLRTAALTLPPHQGSCEGKPAPAGRKPGRFGKGLPGSSPCHKGFAFAEPVGLPVLVSRWHAATSLPKGIQKNLSRSKQYDASVCCLQYTRLQAPSVWAGPQQAQTQGPHPLLPSPQTTTSGHSSTQGTHSKILHTSHSQCPDLTATGASLLLTPAHPS